MFEKLPGLYPSLHLYVLMLHKSVIEVNSIILNDSSIIPKILR